MGIDLSALIVDERADDARELIQALAPDVSFVESDFTNSVHRAVQSHTDGDYNICFVSEAFPTTELEAFFKDLKQLGKDKTCVFIQVKKDVKEDFDRSSLNNIGISTVISRKCTHDDKTAIHNALKSAFYQVEVEKRKVDVNGALKLLLKELDRNASDRRRGVKRKMAAIPMDLVEIHTAFDDEVLDDYFKTLEKQTSTAAPIAAQKLRIPAKVLGKRLPGLSEESYTGASSRVWEMLLEKHGIKLDGKQTADPEPTTHEQSPEEPEDKEEPKDN